MKTLPQKYILAQMTSIVKKKKILISDQDFTWQENKKPIALMIIMQSTSKFKSSLYNMVYDYVITNFNMVMIFF